jgi:hypothetical protein
MELPSHPSTTLVKGCHLASFKLRLHFFAHPIAYSKTNFYLCGRLSGNSLRREQQKQYGVVAQLVRARDS